MNFFHEWNGNLCVRSTGSEFSAFALITPKSHLVKISNDCTQFEQKRSYFKRSHKICYQEAVIKFKYYRLPLKPIFPFSTFRLWKLLQIIYCFQQCKQKEIVKRSERCLRKEMENADTELWLFPRPGNTRRCRQKRPDYAGHFSNKNIFSPGSRFYS